MISNLEIFSYLCVCIYFILFFFEGQFLKIYCVIGGQWALQNFKLLPGTIFVTTTKYAFELTISRMTKKLCSCHYTGLPKSYFKTILKDISKSM